MNNTLFFALTANGNSFLDNAAEAGTVTLVGMVAIFGVLALLWGMIEIMHGILTPSAQKAADRAIKAEEKAKAKAEAQAKADAKKAAAAASTPAMPAANSENGELIAVITAAVAAAMSEDGYTGGFRVVSFKRASARKNGRF